MKYKSVSFYILLLKPYFRFTVNTGDSDPRASNTYEEVHGLIHGMLTSCRIRGLIKRIVVSWPHAQRNKAIGPHFPCIESHTHMLSLCDSYSCHVALVKGVQLQETVIILPHLKCRHFSECHQIIIFNFFIFTRYQFRGVPFK